MWSPRKSSFKNDLPWTTFDIALLILALFLPFLVIGITDGCRMPLFVCVMGVFSF